MKYTKLIVLALVSFVAGGSLLFYPEDVSPWIIRGVGFLWILEGINYVLDLIKKYLEFKIDLDL
jgi:uncharacterized membrane protein HdeD (DUF308 family)